MKLFFAIPFCAALVLLTGCCSIDYKGEELPPLVSRKPVISYYSPEQVPVKQYRVLGEAVVKAGTNWTVRELEEKLRDFARKKGANGLLIISVDRIPAGEARMDQVKNEHSVQWNTADNTSSSLSLFDEYLVNYGKTGKSEVEVFKLQIKAKLLLLPTDASDEDDDDI